LRPLAPWLLQDLAAADLSSEREYDASSRDDANASSHTEVSIEIASVDDDSTDASLLSVRSAASLEDFSENLSNAPEAPSRGSGSDEINMADMRRQAMLEMNQLRWTAMRQQAHASYNTGSELHRQGKVNEAVQHLKSALESAREAHDATLEALVLSRLGLVCNRAGKHGKAIGLFKAALRSVKRALPPESAVMQQMQGKTLHEADAGEPSHAPPAAGRGGGGGGDRGVGGAGGDSMQRCTCETVDESTSTSTCLLALQVLSKYFFVPVKQVLLYLLPLGQARASWRCRYSLYLLYSYKSTNTDT
jgi:tetratricopeptide (TPR) repeat protein